MLGGRGFRVATVFGLPLRIDPTWFIVLVLLSWTLAKGYFPPRYSGLSETTYWALGVGAALLLFVSVLVHEFGHAMMARRCRIPVEGITLFMFGGVSELSEEPPNAAAEAKVTLAGWLISAALAGIFYAVHRALEGREGAVIAYALSGYLAMVNALLFAFNGIPGFPLDGGRLLRALIWRVTGSLRKATLIASSIGAAFGMALILLGVLDFIFGHPVQGIWLVLIGLFLRSGAQASYSHVLVWRALHGVPVRDLMTREVVSIPAETTLDAVVGDYFLHHHFHSFPVLRNGELLGMLDIHDVKHADRSQWAARTAGDVLDARATPPETLPPTADAMEALALMGRTGKGRFPVTEDGGLVGIISRRDILHFLAVRTDLLPEQRT